MDGAAIASATRFRYVEACAGAGGMGLGLHMAGWTGTGMERDPDAVATHNANVGPCLLADITTASAPHGADLVAGGVPCQSFSMEGKGAGLDDPRGQLFRSLLRLAVGAGARCVLMENVRGLVSRGALPVILAAFRAHGFHATHMLLSADDYGAPQERVRLFIAGFRDAADLARFRWPAPSHGAPGNLFGLPRHRTIRDALGLPEGLGMQWKDCGPGSEQATATPRGLDVPAYCVTANGTRSPGGLRVVMGVCPDVDAAWAKASALLADSIRMAPSQIAALQSFPAGFVFHGNVTSQYRQAGNAVPPLLAEAIGRSIATALYGGAA